MASQQLSSLTGRIKSLRFASSQTSRWLPTRAPHTLLLTRGTTTPQLSIATWSSGLVLHPDECCQKHLRRRNTTRLPWQVVMLRNRQLVLPETSPAFTLLMQSLRAAWLALEGLRQLVPEVTEPQFGQLSCVGANWRAAVYIFEVELSGRVCICNMSLLMCCEYMNCKLNSRRSCQICQKATDLKLSCLCADLHRQQRVGFQLPSGAAGGQPGGCLCALPDRLGRHAQARLDRQCHVRPLNPRAALYTRANAESWLSSTESLEDLLPA